MTTILDVIDNFFYRGPEDVRRIPGARLVEFAEEVRRFASSSEPERKVKPGAQYIGGWPSAAFTDVGTGVISSSLLLCEQVLVKDPIIDWFSDERYINLHTLGSAPGWMNPDGGPNTAYTRCFLANVLPALQELRPLIDAGLMTLVPMERIYHRQAPIIESLRTRLGETLLGDPLNLATRFDVSELTHDDALRGIFVFAGGEWEQQISKAFNESLLYFSREYSSVSALGGTYCAPFRFERFLCSEGLGQVLTRADRIRVCLLNSRLPVFDGLTPALLASIHEDDRFGEIRGDLHRIYDQAPIDGTQTELDAFVREQEEVYLRPVLDRTLKEADRGVLSRAGLALSPVTFQMVAGIGLGVASGSIWPTAIAGAAMAVDQLVSARREGRGVPAWTALVNHGRGVTDEMPGASLREAQLAAAPATSEDAHPWGIPKQPSMTVSVSRGAIRANWLPTSSLDQPASIGYAEGVYAPCPCGSGLKYRFCCQSTDKRFGRNPQPRMRRDQSKY